MIISYFSSAKGKRYSSKLAEETQVIVEYLEMGKNGKFNQSINIEIDMSVLFKMRKLLLEFMITTQLCSKD